MVAVSTPFSLDDYPAEMVLRVAEDAALDADRVGVFLSSLGLRGSPGKPLSLPVNFLLHLGAALRLLVWETQGFLDHQVAGLPDAHTAIRAAIHSLKDPQAEATQFCTDVFRFSVEHFAWSAGRELGVDVALGEADEDALLEGLADFLWAKRAD
jgi:hypothetical protein